MQVVSIINYKGGVGKTTTTANIAAQLAWTGKKVLLIDLDPQASLTFSLVRPEEWESSLADERTIKRWFDGATIGDEFDMRNLLCEDMLASKVVQHMGRLALIPSHLGLINVDLELATQLGGANMSQAKRNYVRVHSRLANGLAHLAHEGFDLALIDCPPNFNIVTKTAIVASDYVLVPAKPDYLSTLGISYLQRNLRQLVDDYNEYAGVDGGDSVETIDPKVLGVVFTMVQFRNQEPISKGRAHALALAGEAWYGLVLHLTQLGELVPDRPLRKLGDSLQALAAPYTGWRLRVTADHDWLAPEIAKEVRLAAWRPAGGEPPAGFEVTPLGEWSKRSVGEPKSSSPKTLFSLLPLAHRFQVGEVVERLAPVVGGAVVEAAGERFRLADVLLLEANRPVEMRAQSAPLTAVGGRTATASAVLRNWSPYPVTMTVAATGPQGWRCLPEPARIEVPALGDREVKVAVTPPEDSPRGSYEFLLTANHSAAAETAVAAIMKVALSRALTPLSADGRWQPPKPEERARIRQRGKLVFQAEPGPEVAITIRNVRVTIYANALDYRLLDPDLKVVESGRLPVDQEQVIRLSAKEAGTYTLEVRPGSGSADVTIATRPAAEVATRDDPLQLFTSPIKRWFYVPRGARQFRIGWQDGGVDETAHLTIVSPTGRVAYDFSGNCAGVETPVDVHADEAGRVWTIQVDPRQDMHFWLAGDVAPYLSTSPERVLREAGAP